MATLLGNKRHAAIGVAAIIATLIVLAVLSRSPGGGRSHGLYALAPRLIDILDDASAVAEFKIQEVHSPRWNSTDGDEWEGTEHIPPLLFSQVDGSIERVIRGAITEGPLTIVVRGDARTRYEDGDLPPADARSGGFIEGQTFLVVLRQAEFLYQDGPQDVWTLAANFEGNWRIAGGEAIRSDHRWRMPPEELEQALRKAWDERRKPSDDRGLGADRRPPATEAV